MMERADTRAKLIAAEIGNRERKATALYRPYHPALIEFADILSLYEKQLIAFFLPRQHELWNPQFLHHRLALSRLSFGSQPVIHVLISPSSKVFDLDFDYSCDEAKIPLIRTIIKESDDPRTIPADILAAHYQRYAVSFRVTQWLNREDQSAQKEKQFSPKPALRIEKYPRANVYHAEFSLTRNGSLLRQCIHENINATYVIDNGIPYPRSEFALGIVSASHLPDFRRNDYLALRALSFAGCLVSTRPQATDKLKQSLTSGKKKWPYLGTKLKPFE